MIELNEQELMMIDGGFLPVLVIPVVVITAYSVGKAIVNAIKN